MMLDIDFSGVCGRLKLALLGQILNITCKSKLLQHDDNLKRFECDNLESRMDNECE